MANDENKIDESASRSLKGESSDLSREAGWESQEADLGKDSKDLDSAEEKEHPLLEPYDGSEPLENINWEKFAHAYVRCGVGARAVLAAGYAKSSSRTMATLLFRHASVRARINFLKNSAGWTIEKTKYEVNDGYREAKRTNNLRERREFARFMADLMGYGNSDPVAAVTGLLGQIGNILTMYRDRYQTVPTSDISSKVTELPGERQPDSLLG